MTALRVGLVVCSDRAAAGERADRTGELLRGRLAEAGHDLVESHTVADERDLIADLLRRLCERLDLVLTSGGTGIAPRDVTVEATRDVLEREVPGLAEAMRRKSLEETPRALLSRATAGSRGRALIVNLPGSPRGALTCLEAVLPVVDHAHRLLQGAVRDCQEGRA